MTDIPQYQLLIPRYLVPIRPAGVVLQQHALLMNGSQIVALGPLAELKRSHQGADQVLLPHHALIPGLINAHTHTPMNLLRGWRDDEDLQVWLNQYIWPVERRWVSPEFARDGSRLAVAEMLRSGTTCFNDNYFFPEQTARVAADAGMRAVIGVPLMEHANAWSQSLEHGMELGASLLNEWQEHPAINISLAPHAPYSVSNDALEKVAATAVAHDCRVHMHVLETAWEVGHSLREHGCRPLNRLDQLGLLNDRLIAVHMTQLMDQDIEWIADRGCHVVHCPESNLKLASGMSPVAAMLSAGVNVAIGTDGAASNNDLDMFGEMRTASLLAKGASQDPRAVPAQQALEMATLGGARALGIGDRAGSLETGKQADVVAVDLRDLSSQPVHDVFSQLVYAAGRSQVSDVWVAGRRVVANRKLLNLDESELLDTAERWQARLMEGEQQVRESAL